MVSCACRWWYLHWRRQYSVNLMCLEMFLAASALISEQVMFNFKADEYYGFSANIQHACFLWQEQNALVFIWILNAIFINPVAVLDIHLIELEMGSSDVVPNGRFRGSLLQYSSHPVIQDQKVLYFSFEEKRKVYIYLSLCSFCDVVWVYTMWKCLRESGRGWAECLMWAFI